jgi:hypothetical protein
VNKGFALALVLLAAACAQHAGHRIANPVPFPLYRDSSVLAVHTWHRVLTSGERTVFGITGSQNTAYRGYEVVSATGDSFDDVSAWIQSLTQHPPNGYRIAVWGSGVEEARASARNIGIDFGIFGRNERAVSHDVAVIAVDPALLQKRAGVMLSLLARYRNLPSFLQSAMNAQVKAQTGFTASEVLDPQTPVGAAIDALASLHDRHDRGVILIDAVPADAKT